MPDTPMYLIVGNHQFPAGSLRVASNTESIESSSSIPYELKTTLFVDGYIIGDGQADLTNKQLEMEAALQQTNPSIRFMQGDGSDSATILSAEQTLTGVRITRYNFPSEDGNEYATQRQFTFEAWAHIRPAGVDPSLVIEFREQFQFSGGGPLYVMKRCLKGPVIRQKVCEQTEYSVIQRGELTSLSPNPAVPPPRWPGALKQSGDPALISPDRKQNYYTNYRATWLYIHESPTPLTGVPWKWMGVS